MFLHIILLILSIFLLWFGANYLVESAGRIAKKLGISELVIGLTVVAFGTSAPEFAVSIGAALTGNSSIAVGNVVGSNIFNMSFILGTIAVIRPIKTSKSLVYRDGVLLIVISFLLLLFFYDLKLELWEGAILFAMLLIYLVLLFVKKEIPEEDEIPQDSATRKDYFILPASILAVLAGGHLLVEHAIPIAEALGVSKWVISVTIVAAGTSAPEMATALTALIKGKHGLSAGSLVGSDIFNLLGVLGLAGILQPLHIAKESFSSLLMLSAMVVVAVIFFRSGWKLSRKEGVILLLIGIIRWVLDFSKGG